MTTFVLSWDHLGLEACVNVTELDQLQMWKILKGEKENSNQGRDHNINSIMNMLMLRARFNTHRHYEIYAIDVDKTIDEQQLRAMFEEDPQGSADLIRRRGRQLYSDRLKEDHIKIR